MRSVAALACAGGLLAACTGVSPLVTPEEGERVARQCLEQTNAEGTYSIRPAQGSSSIDGRIPQAHAVENLGGTQAGEDAINSCIRSTILGGQRTIETVRDGDTKIVRYTYGSPPSKTTPLRAREEVLAELEQVRSRTTPVSCTRDAPVMFGGAQYCTR